MNVNARLVCVFALAAVTVFAFGCSDEQPSAEAPKSEPIASTPAGPAAPAVAPPAQADEPAMSEAEGYRHAASGVGFRYPEGYQNLGVNTRGPVT